MASDLASLSWFYLGETLNNFHMYSYIPQRHQSDRTNSPPEQAGENSVTLRPYASLNTCVKISKTRENE